MGLPERGPLAPPIPIALQHAVRNQTLHGTDQPMVDGLVDESTNR